MDTTADPTRRAIWMALADQFLDTETRTWIPQTALMIVEAGYPLEEARRIWRYEVSPAVALNAWSIAGEWAGWDEDWLFERIESMRGRWPQRPGLVPYLLYRLQVHFIHGSWTAIELCMAALEPLPEKERRNLSADLTYLAELYFDFCVGAPMRLSATRMAELRELYRSTFEPIFGPLVARDSISGESPGACRRRIAVALG